VQSVTQATNVGTTPFTVHGVSTLHIAGAPAKPTDCYNTVIAADTDRWCWGQTYPVARGVGVQGQGSLQYIGGIWYSAWSPLRYTS
jgi:hypothetical protein